MSVSINNLFNYSRSLPVPFDTMTNKKVKVASMYGAKTESTLCGSVIKAVHAMCRCMNGTGEGAVGQIDTNKSVAEYKSRRSGCLSSCGVRCSLRQRFGKRL